LHRKKYIKGQVGEGDTWRSERRRRMRQLYEGRSGRWESRGVRLIYKTSVRMRRGELDMGKWWRKEKGE